MGPSSGLALGKALFLARSNGGGNKRLMIDIPKRPKISVAHIAIRMNVKALCPRLNAVIVATRTVPIQTSIE
jgi:hypothetical protein